jgi:DNA invertase Pin-like site-specific DNA recombinase
VAATQVSPLLDTETEMAGEEAMAEMSIVRRDRATWVARTRVNVPVGTPDELYTENSVPLGSIDWTVPLEEVKAVDLTRTWRRELRNSHISQICVISLKTAMKRAALYMRVSTVDQHPETQLLDLRQLAAQRGFEIIQEYTDRISGAKARRPGLDQMMTDARRGRFDVVLVWASDRIARSTRHFLEVLDELNRLNVEFVSFREQIDTGGPLGRAIVVIIGAIAELERNLIIERVRAGMRRARLEGRSIGRPALALDREAILTDRQHGQSLEQIARAHRISRTTVHRVIHKEMPVNSTVPKGV